MIAVMSQAIHYDYLKQISCNGICLCYYLFIETKHASEMKMEKKVESLLVKWGNNHDDVKAMMSKWFEVIYNGNKDEKPSYIANMIRTAW